MAKDVSDVVKGAVKTVVTDVGKGVGDTAAGLNGAKGIAAGAAAVALAPMAVKGVSKLMRGAALNGVGDVVKSPVNAVDDLTSGPSEKITGGIGEKITGGIGEKLDSAVGPGGMLKDAIKSALPFGGGDDDDQGDQKGGVPGTGKGRRMPVQQSVDIGVPIETIYNQWTQYEEWPNFMHRVTRVTQEDETTVSFAVKIWAKTKEFTAKIETQRPDERVKWRVSEGITHTGVVTLHELAPRLTRIELLLDVEPGGMLEKAARGMRHVNRAARGDLHRFKAFIEMLEHETGAWRGVIEDGEVVEEHDPSYDKDREFADIEDLKGDSSGGKSDDKQERSRSGQGGRRSASAQQSRGRSRASRSSSNNGSERSSGRSRTQTTRGRSSGSGRSRTTRR